MGTNSELAGTGCLCTLGGDGRLGDEPQQRPLGAGTLDGRRVRSQEQEGSVVSSFPSATKL